MPLALQQIEPSESPSSPEQTLGLIGPIGPDMLDKLFPAVANLLAPSLEADGWKVKIPDLYKLFVEGGLHLWICVEIKDALLLAALATEELSAPNARIFSLAYLGGEQMERWTPLLAELEKIARKEGYTAMQIRGRKGWGRIFPDYKESYRVFEKSLVGGQS